VFVCVVCGCLRCREGGRAGQVGVGGGGRVREGNCVWWSFALFAVIFKSLQLFAGEGGREIVCSGFLHCLQLFSVFAVVYGVGKEEGAGLGREGAG
jgi:hypothetical protein